MDRWAERLFAASLVFATACQGSMSDGPGIARSEDAGRSAVDAAAQRDAGPHDADAGNPPPDAAPPDAFSPAVGALAGLPSAPGPHIARIAALGADEWMQLDPPAPDPAWGAARGRSWGGRAFALAPSLRGAFFMGEGLHAYVKPDAHAMDDIWFYDIHANRWIAVYPGTDTATFDERVASGELRIDEDGQLTEAGGGLVPVHTLIHAWDFLAYDTDRERFAFLAGNGLGRYYMPGLDQIDEGLTELEVQREEHPPGPMSPWYYDVGSGLFTRMRADNGRSDVGGYSAFAYVPYLHVFLNAGSRGVQTYDPEANHWERVEDSGPRPPSYDHGVCYDPVRQRLYMGPGDNSGGIYVYDIASRTWSFHEPAGGPAGFRTNDASIFYDEANGVVTVFQYDDGIRYVYDPDADTWTSTPIPADVLSAVSRASYNAFYDPELNAYFVYAAGDSRGGGRMFVYRYRPRP